LASATANGRTAAPPRVVPADRPAEYRLAGGVAIRIGILGIVALVVFGVLFLRLWALQVLSGTQYLRAAKNNQLRTMPLQAARGAIVDRNGLPLVMNVAGTSIRVWPSDLPKQGRYVELKRLARLVDVPFGQIAGDLRKHARDPLAPVTVDEAARNDVVFYLSEHRDEFPGVEIERSYLRHYPYGTLGAQVLGAVGEVSQEQLDSSAGRGLRPGVQIGQSGLERAYDAYLRGQTGVAHLRVDSLGRPRSALQVSHEPTPGYQLRLTLDVKVQQAAERALRYGIQAARNEGAWAADGGAIVALDPRDGSILAMASSPTYDPAVYVRRRPLRALKPLINQTAAEKANVPGLNRAIEGTYPPGSTFKPVTALAALEEHLISPYDTLSCTGQIRIKGQLFKNWDPYVYEGMSMPVALAASCDTYFYQLGYKFYLLPKERGQPLQEWASRFGFGRKTGVDLGGEQAGLLPTIKWRHETYTPKTDPKHWQIDRLWKPGDSIQLAIGQKDIAVTPLQMARFYALIANGGRLVTPHLAEDVEQPGNGRSPAVVRRRFAPPAPQRLDVDPSALDVVRAGLDEATHGTLGTSQAIFGTFPVRIAGKTGTAEKTVFLPGQKTGLLLSQSWWCGYGPTENPTIVVCAVIENGGHGGTAAAPAALKVFEQYFGRQATQHGTVYSD
jgi:penicillin-binding protein 2